VTALEAEYRYLIERALRQNKKPLAHDLVLAAMKHDIDLSEYL
jgi:hypothetical protein